MLSAPHRLRDSRSFATVVRRGRRAGARTLVVHLLLPSAGPAAEQECRPMSAPRVGLVVSKAVGASVVRNRVKRRLRHLLREHLASLPDSAMLVVRALPPAASASHVQLSGDLEATLGRVLERSRERTVGS